MNILSEHPQYFNAIIALLIRFLDRFEGRKTIKPDFKYQQYSNIQPQNLTVIHKPLGIRKSVPYNYFQTIGHLRQKIAEAFEIAPNEFLMHTKSHYIDPDEEDDKYIKDLGYLQGIFLMNNPNYIKDAHPKLLIGSN